MNFKKIISLFAIVLFLGSGSIFAMESNSDTDEQTAKELAFPQMELNPEEQRALDAISDEKMSDKAAGAVEKLPAKDGDKTPAATPSRLAGLFYGVGGRLAGIARGGIDYGKRGLACSVNTGGSVVKYPFAKGKDSLGHAYEALKLLKSCEFKKAGGKAIVSTKDGAMAILSAVAIVHGVDAALILAAHFGFEFTLWSYSSGMLTTAAYEKCADFVATATPVLWSMLGALGGHEDDEPVLEL